MVASEVKLEVAWRCHMETQNTSDSCRTCCELLDGCYQAGRAQRKYKTRRKYKQQVDPSERKSTVSVLVASVMYCGVLADVKPMKTCHIAIAHLIL